MIGVAAKADDLVVVEEFFQLFKTWWEPASPSRSYSVVLSAGEPIEPLQAESYLVYGSEVHPVDRALASEPVQLAGPADVRWHETVFPVYGRLALFDGDEGILRCGARSVDRTVRARSGAVRRIGYDIFEEVRHLLTVGQPQQWAAMPTLELHVALLRRSLLDLGVPFVEIPPRPGAHDFACCLTHDLDFFGIRRHVTDRTILGFAARASVGTLVDLIRGRRPVTEAVQNWMALLVLPLVFFGLLPDFWRPFDDYATAEAGHRATFFVVPFKNRPGVGPDGVVRATRGVPYQLSEIQDEARTAEARGHELALHGLDAWRDADAGREERAEVVSVTARGDVGVRMHWLYFSEESASRLDEAGFEYDSTWGYNDAVGYRAGTSQVFRPGRTERLLELPMSIMDSAMFFPDRMGLSREQASTVCADVVDNARRFGGTVVINWHDRSLVPERLWGAPYRWLLSEVARDGRAWFATAGEAVAWFRWRRSIEFRTDGSTGHVRVVGDERPAGLPAARIAVHRPTPGALDTVEERAFERESVLTLPL